MEQFNFPKIEVRSSIDKGVKKYIIKGYATTKGNPYAYEKIKDKEGNPIKSFREFFTEEGMENIRRKAKIQNIWVDYGHHTAFGYNIQKALADVETRSGIDLSEEKNYVKNAFQIGDIPMFKLEDLSFDDNGAFVEIHANPFYENYSEEHKKKFETTWNSLENGFINGISLNFKPYTVKVNDTLNAINDADIFGISLLSGASNDMATITEVAVRCCTNRGEQKWQEKRSPMTSSLMM